MRLAGSLLPIVLILLTVTVLQPSRYVKAQAPAANPTALRMTLVVPPNSLNEMTITSGTAGYYIAGLLLSGAVPGVQPNGSDVEHNSLTDRVWSNPNYTIWYLHTKPGLKWSDGTNVTVNDILSTWSPRFAFDPIYDFPGTGLEVANEYATSNGTAVFVLNAPDAHFNDRLRGQWFTTVYPASFVQSGGENKTYFENPIGTGPFYVSNYTEGSFQMTMLRNPYYTPQPQISEIDITYVDSKSLTSTPLLSGTTDLAPLEPSNAASILNNPNLRILDQKAFGISTLDYNVSVYPYNMTAFRQALVYGINETQYVQQAFAGYGQPAYSSEGIISPITTWYNPNTIHYDYDQNKAAALLSSIGIVKGSDGYLHYPNGTDVNLVLWAATDNTPDIVGASTIQQNLQALGFNVKVVTTSSSNIISDYGSNIDNIRQAIILYSNYIPIWGLPFTDIEPAWDVYWLPTVVQPYWEYPPSIDAQYQGNYTLFKQTNDPTMVRQTLNKVQQLNAEYLPTIVLAYPDALWGYNIQHWTNWPSGYIEFGSEQFNWTTFEALTPTTAAPITTTSSTSAGFPASYAAAIVVVVLIVVVAAVYSRTRKSKLKE